MRTHAWNALQILIAVTVLRAATLVIPVFNQDEAYIAVQAAVINDGGELYRDVVDRKPPLVPGIYAAVFRAVGGDSLIAVHVLMIVWVTATALVLGAIMRRRAGPREARWATWLFVLGSMALLPRDALAANFELWMLLPICTAMLVGGRGQPLGDLAAGGLVAIAMFMKQPALVTLAPLVCAIVRAPNRAIGLACVVAGFGTVVAVVVRTHDPRLLQWGFFGTGGYLRVDDLLFAIRLAAIWSGTFLLASAAIGWLVVRAARMRGYAPDLDLWIWLGTAVLGVVAGFRFLGHYHLQLVPAACLLAARPAAALHGAVRRRVIAGVLMPALLCGALAFVVPNYVVDTDYRGVASYLRERTASTDRIFVWGHFPEIYWAAERLPAIRFVHTGFMTGHSGARPIRPHDTSGATPGTWDDAFEDLARTRPVYVVDLAPGNVRSAGAFPIDAYPRLAAWLRARYGFEAIVDGIWLYRRRD
jgi:hypothetical protein